MQVACTQVGYTIHIACKQERVQITGGSVRILGCTKVGVHSRNGCTQVGVHTPEVEDALANWVHTGRECIQVTSAHGRGAHSSGRTQLGVHSCTGCTQAGCTHETGARRFGCTHAGRVHASRGSVPTGEGRMQVQIEPQLRAPG